MIELRSPWLPLICGTIFLILSIAVRMLGGGILASVLLTLALPLLFEGGAWFGAAKIGRLYYDLDERVIHSQAYDPRALLVRYAVICALLFGILIAREADALPGGPGGWLGLVLAGLLWFAFVLRSYGRQISNLARQENVPLSPPS
jgi:hypothetical protein